MTARERLLSALRLKRIDRVPVSPDISIIYPAMYSGKPFWEVLLYENPPVWKIIADLGEEYGFDVMLQVPMDKSSTEQEIESTKIIEKNEDCQLVEHIYYTPYGQLTQTVQYPISEAPWRTVALVKDVEEDMKKILALFQNPQGKGIANIEKAKKYIGDRGLVGDYIGVPSYYWCLVRGSIQDAIMDYYDYPAVMRRFTKSYLEYGLEYIQSSCERARPDYFMFGGSYASMSVISPDFYKEHNLLFVQKATDMLKRFGIPSCLHMCGRSNEMIEVFANETNLNMLEPLEGEPGGNVVLSEVKRKYGHKLCLKGNINTFDILERSTPLKVTEEVRRCINDAAAGGGFILSTGDQVTRDTPEENFVALISAAHHYGRYTHH